MRRPSVSSAHDVRPPQPRRRLGAAPYHRRVSAVTGSPSRRASASSPSCRSLPSLGRRAPMDAAEAFRDLPGLALLESARPGRTGRWSYLTADPDRGPRRAVGGRGPVRRGAGAARPDRRDDAEGLPPFAGGLVGYLGYDLGRRFERLPSIARVDQHLPVMRLGLYDWAIAWDRRRRRGVARGACRGRRPGRAGRGAIRDVLDRVDALERGRGPRRRPDVRARRDGAIDERIPAVAPDAPAAFVSGTTHAAWVDGRRGGPRRDRAGRDLPGQPHPPARGPVRRRPVAAVPAPADRRPGAVRGLPRPRPVARDRDAAGAPVREPGAVPVASTRTGTVTTDPIKGTRPRGRDPRAGPRARPRAARRARRTRPRT